jgi:MraZ protein
MTRFNDRYFLSIDQKGRLALTREIRDRFKVKRGDPIHLMPNPNTPPFLEIRTQKQWDEFQNRLMAQPPSNSKRDFLRFLKLMHETVTADAQGRIVIPQRLRDFCRFDSDIAIINMETYVEVWDKNSVEQKYSDMLKAFNDINDQLF